VWWSGLQSLPISQLECGGKWHTQCPPGPLVVLLYPLTPSNLLSIPCQLNMHDASYCATRDATPPRLIVRQRAAHRIQRKRAGCLAVCSQFTLASCIEGVCVLHAVSKPTNKHGLRGRHWRREKQYSSTQCRED
jgi:hypothetical protein